MAVFNIEVKSNILGVRQFIENLLRVHRQIPGSAFASPDHQTLELRNTAVTLDKNGQPFEYFDSIDKGRSAIHRDRYLLRFAQPQTGTELSSHHVKGTHGQHIVVKALGKINATAQRELDISMAAWVKSANEAVLLNRKQSLKLGGKLIAQSGATSRPILIRGNSKTVNTRQLINSGVPLAGSTPLDGQPIFDKVLKLAQESKASFDVDRIIDRATPDPAIRAQAKANPGIRRLVKLPNWPASRGIFANHVADQVLKFQAVTPSRAELGHFKLVYGKSGVLETIGPESGGSLKAGYKLTTK